MSDGKSDGKSDDGLLNVKLSAGVEAVFLDWEGDPVPCTMLHDTWRWLDGDAINERRPCPGCGKRSLVPLLQGERCSPCILRSGRVKILGVMTVGYEFEAPGPLVVFGEDRDLGPMRVFQRDESEVHVSIYVECLRDGARFQITTSKPGPWIEHKAVIELSRGGV